eukprot:TRINITY_DN8449_c0_g1_i1.p1 TRINITY_DN8449_c0_g1~~TRINITY_DN8449_c0_g1_i1.p1  ORF type:complete len:343 (+),score=123.27 TRINITY_DN8449_c0_g1_i1:86-1114(+)
MNLLLATRDTFEKKDVKFFTFNQDSSQATIVTKTGFYVFNTSPVEKTFEKRMSGVGQLVRVGVSSLVVIVGSGIEPTLSARSVVILNAQSDLKTDCTTSPFFATLQFLSPVLNVLVNNKRIIVILENEISIFQSVSFKKIDSFQTALNPLGICALTDNEKSLIAYPAERPGDLIFYDARKRSLKNQISAHNNSIGFICFNCDGSLLASVSTRGTVVRIFNVNQREKLYEFSRGTFPNTVICMAFNKSSTFLCVTTISGSLHICKIPDSPITNLSTYSYLNPLSYLRPYANISEHFHTSGTIRAVCAMENNRVLILTEFAELIEYTFDGINCTFASKRILLQN